MREREQKCALPRAIGANDREHFAALNIERLHAQDLAVISMNEQVANLNHALLFVSPLLDPRQCEVNQVREDQQ